MTFDAHHHQYILEMQEYEGEPDKKNKTKKQNRTLDTKPNNLKAIQSAMVTCIAAFTKHVLPEFLSPAS